MKMTDEMILDVFQKTHGLSGKKAKDILLIIHNKETPPKNSIIISPAIMDAHWSNRKVGKK